MQKVVQLSDEACRSMKVVDHSDAQKCCSDSKQRRKPKRCVLSSTMKPKKILGMLCTMSLDKMDSRNLNSHSVNVRKKKHIHSTLAKRLSNEDVEVSNVGASKCSVSKYNVLNYHDSYHHVSHHKTCHFNGSRPDTFRHHGSNPEGLNQTGICRVPARISSDQLPYPLARQTTNSTRYPPWKRRVGLRFVLTIWQWTTLLLLVLGGLPGPVLSSECQACIGVPCQKVMGLFTRTPLPVGYNVIATIPARACNLTVRETANTNNYLALRSNNRYIINGNWDVQPSGRYMGAGTGFVYSHPMRSLEALRLVGGTSRLDSVPGQGEKIESPGAFTQQLELMVIYQEANLGISYEYWSPLLSSEVTNTALHAGTIADVNDEVRRNQIFQNLVRNQEREITDTSIRRQSNTRGHLSSRRPPFRSRIQEQSRAESFQDPVLIPVTSRRRGSTVGADTRRTGGPKKRRRKGRRRKPSPHLHNIQPAYSSFSNWQAQQNLNSRAEPTLIQEPNSPIVAPIMEPIQSHQLQRPMFDPLDGMIGNSIPEFNATEIMFPAWKVWQFTPCSRSCGGGTQQAVHICTSLSGHVVSESLCGGEASRPVEQTMECNTKPCPPEWQLSDWSPCSVTCGSGMQSRTWACIQVVSPTLTRAVSPTMCPMPSMTHVPLTKPCNVGDCTRWSAQTWSPCSVECGTGVQNRDVLCLMESEAVTSVLPDAACNEQERPPRQQLCHAASCGRNVWFFTEWSSQCIGGCENGRQYRKVWCSSLTQSGSRGSCPAQSRPPEAQPCSKDASCAAIWFTGPWTQCSVACGGGNRTREVVCVVFLRGSFRATLDLECDARTRPVGREPCNSLVCPPHWYFTEWTTCSRSCGRGSQERAVQCLDSQQIPSVQCSVSDRPSRTRVCNLSKCSSHISLSRDEPGYRSNTLAATGRASSSTACIDRFRNCKLVQQARLCRFSYYNTVCCESCGG